MKEPRPNRLAGFLDATLLIPAADNAVLAAWGEASRLGCAAFVTHPDYLTLLGGESATALSAVIDFPFGLSSTDDKLRVIDVARRRGARELELVVNGRLAAGEAWEALERELTRLEAGSRGAVRKVILETGLRTAAQAILLARMVAGLGFEYVKTSTGFMGRGASTKDVELLVEAVGGNCAVKASGGIRDLDACLAMIGAGAGRIGTSSAAAILAEASARASTVPSKREPGPAAGLPR